MADLQVKNARRSYQMKYPLYSRSVLQQNSGSSKTANWKHAPREFFYMAKAQFPEDPPEQEPIVMVPSDPAPVSVVNHDLPAPQEGELEVIHTILLHAPSFYLVTRSYTCPGFIV